MSKAQTNTFLRNKQKQKLSDGGTKEHVHNSNSKEPVKISIGGTEDSVVRTRCTSVPKKALCKVKW